MGLSSFTTHPSDAVLPLSKKPSPHHAAFGWCSRCHKDHRLEEGHARKYAQQLMKELETLKRIDFECIQELVDPRFSTDYLFGEALGQMFGVLECEDEAGNIVVLRAFSCQYNAVWNIEGWVPPVFDVDAYDQIMVPGDGAIKELTRKIDSLSPGAEDFEKFKLQRKRISQSTMKELQALYQLNNFRGESRPLTDFFKNTNGPPTGAGDCCAPKLLQHAALNNLLPLGIAEFYWGKPNRSGTREHGCFYSSCMDKCVPILGFMLCGAKL